MIRNIACIGEHETPWEPIRRSWQVKWNHTVIRILCFSYTCHLFIFHWGLGSEGAFLCNIYLFIDKLYGIRLYFQIKSNNSESYPGDIWITVFVNGSVRPSNTVLRLGYPMPINGTNNPIYLGQATIQHCKYFLTAVADNAWIRYNSPR